MQNYQDLDHGDVDKVKVNLIEIARLEARSYKEAYGHGTDNKFAVILSEVDEIYSSYQATNKSSK